MFSKMHIQLALEIIASRRRVGRMELAKKLGVGEGSVRTILNILREKGLITSSRGGHFLTRKGKNVVGNFPTYVTVNVRGITVGEVNVGTLVRNAAKKIRYGVEQRDEAIKAGAQGATVLIFKNGKFGFPDNFIKIDKKTSDALVKLFKPKDGDVLVIGTGEDVEKARAGARAAALSLRKMSEI